MTSPLVTVCIPTIGRTAMVRETWNSLQSQTYSNLEILLLDNGSDPVAGAELRAMVESDPRSRVLRVEERIPLFANFDRGRLAARGVYLVYFHDDDVYQPSFIERHVAALESAPTCTFSGCNCDYIDEHGRNLGTRNLIARTGIWEGRKFIERLLRLGRNPVAFQGVMWRRECIPDGLFTDEKGPHYTDFVMLMQLAEKAPVSVIAERLVHVRLHSAAGSAIRASWGFPLMRDVLLGYLREAHARGALDEAFVRAQRVVTERAVRRGLALGWLQASDRTEALACVRGIGGGLAWRVAAVGMGIIDAIGLRGPLRRRVLPWLRVRLRGSAPPVAPARSG